MTAHHECKSSFSTVATYDDDSDTTFSRSSTSRCSRVRFDAVVRVHSIPNKEDLDRENLWWRHKEMELDEMEKFFNACKQQLEKCPRLIRDKHHRQCCADLQGVVRSTNLILSARNLNSNKAVSKLHECLERAPALRSLERYLVPKCEKHMRQHVRSVCRAQRHQNSTKLATTAVTSSQGDVLLGQILARHDFVQAYSKLHRELQ